jgi:septum formation protein
MLHELGIPFREFHSKVDERFEHGLKPDKLAVELAKRKTAACKISKSLIIAMDTLVVQGRNIFGKPSDAARATEMLSALSGKKHQVITGVALKYKGKIVSEVESTDVYFRKMKREEIDWYIKTGEPFDKAGAYAIQGLGRIFINKINGCYFNVIGFPIDAFQRALKRLGFTLFDLIVV